MTIRFLKTISLVGVMVLLVFLAQPTRLSIVSGAVFVLTGEMVRIWAAGHLLRNQELTTSGPYAHLRDPLYLGRLFLLTGFCIMAWGHALILLPVGLLVFAYSYMPRKYRKEMSRLEKYFGHEYREYAAYCRSLVPKLTPYRNAEKRRWDFSVFFFENREPYFILIVVSIFVAIVFRLR